MRAGELTLILVVALLTAARPMAAELPPEIQIDRLLVQVQRQMRDGEYAAAAVTLDRILVEREERPVDVPEVFWIRHAEVSLQLDRFDAAEGSATRYLQAAGRPGEYYREALELLDRVDQARARAAAGDAILAAAEPLKLLNSDLNCTWVFEGPEFGGRRETPLREVTAVEFSAGCRLILRVRDTWADGRRSEVDVDAVIGLGNVMTPWVEDSQCRAALGIAFGVHEGVGVYGDGNGVVEERTWYPNLGEWKSDVSSKLYVPLDDDVHPPDIVAAIRTLNAMCESRGG